VTRHPGAGRLAYMAAASGAKGNAPMAAVPSYLTGDLSATSGALESWRWRGGAQLGSGPASGVRCPHGQNACSWMRNASRQGASLDTSVQ
jgi:hypothetical protein